MAHNIWWQRISGSHLFANVTLVLYSVYFSVAFLFLPFVAVCLGFSFVVLQKYPGSQ